MRGYYGILILAIFASLASVSLAQKRLVCYYGGWAVYRPGNGAMPPSKIDPKLCTHLIYSFAGITAAGGMTSTDPWADLPAGGGLDGYNKFVGLKSQNPSLKVMIAVGGWNAGSVTFSNVVKSTSLRAAFVTAAYNFVKTYKFDGLDLDWEYPGMRGGIAADKANFVLLIKELRAKFSPAGLLLSAAVGASQMTGDVAYDIPNLSTYLDFINLMTYDFHGFYEGRTGQNAPLYASSIDTTLISKQLNVHASVNYWLSKGALASKLVLGMGMYGQTYTLSTTAKGLGAPTSGAGIAGPYTQQTGMLGYNEICEKQKSGGWSLFYDTQQAVPFCYSGNQWIGYDDVKSITAKSNYINARGLGGGMIWSIDTDDFRGYCTGTTFPLLRTIKTVLNVITG